MLYGVARIVVTQQEPIDNSINFGLFESLPITGIYIVITLLLLVSGELGYRIGERIRMRRDQDVPVSMGAMVGGLLGMLGFVLALTFAMAASQHYLRKQNVLNEANTIGTAYLRTDLIDKQYGTEVKRLLREYVDIRLQAAGASDVTPAIARSVEIHELLWAQVSAAAKARPDTNTVLMIQSINDVIDMHEKRVTGALRNRIPSSVWVAFMIITTLAMVTMGIEIGLAGKRTFYAVIPLSLAFAMLVILVVDLDRPLRGLIKVGQQSMVDLQQSMSRDAK